MDTALSDVLTCPRCGPTYGLVLVPHEASGGRVVRGVLGCANCRERYEVRGGVADFRRGESASVVGGVEGVRGWSWAGSEEPAVRLGGLLGLSAGRGPVLVGGPAVEHVHALVGLVEGVEVLAVAAAGGSVEAGPGVSPILVASVLPVRSGALAGVALTGSCTSLLEEGARVLGGGGRLVVEPAPVGSRGRLEAAGLAVVAEEGEVVVASRGA